MSEDLLKTYQRTVDQADLVSFDVFDTLIHRIVLRPVHVFDLLAKRLGTTDIALYHPRLVAGLPQLREHCERKARERHFRNSGTHEIGLGDIYTLLQETTGLDDELITRILGEELLLEQALVYANPGMRSLHGYALAKGKPVILCSDMYLSAEHITSLLTKAGFQPPFDLFVSGELKKSKHEGSMFELVAERYGVTPDKMAHFGDNQQADFEIPSKKGILAHHFNSVSLHTESRLRFPPTDTCGDRAVTSLIQGTIRSVLLRDAETEDFWFDLGVQIFGPLFLGKFIWLMGNLRHQPVDKVLFFARDALFSHTLYQRYAASLGINIPAEYAYFSRAALLVPSFTDMNMHRVWHLFGGRATRAVKKHLARLDIDPSLVGREIREAGFDSENDIAQNSDFRMFNLLNRLYPLILETSKRHRDIVARYVQQVAGSGQKIAIVDIGWTGNMQGSFSRLLQLSRNDFELTGYYYGTFEGIWANYMPRNTYRCYLVREMQPRSLYESLVNGGVELMEFSHMAPHGTTLGYENIAGKIHPLLEDNREDKNMQELAARVQRGALRFVEAAMPAVLAVGAEQLVSTAWSEPFFDLVNHPTRKEAELLGNLTHSDSATDTLNRLPLAAKLDPRIARLRGGEYRKAHHQAYWKKAFEIINS